MNIQDETCERFLSYVKIDTRSDEESGCHPSTKKQLDLARLLSKELQELQVEYFFDEEKGYLYAWLPDNSGNGRPAIGFISHMDTSPEASGTNVRPQFVRNYRGGDIVLGKGEIREGESQVEEDNGENPARVLRPVDFPELKKYIGDTIITSDGTTLLGADDKAGIAEIMTMVSYFCAHPEIPHGRICVAFTPDEEIGEGTYGFDIERFGADYAYTVDGGELGEISYENFNAASATIRVIGRNVHPGEAFGKMIHAARIAMEIEAGLPGKERPEKTKDHQGFYHLTDMSGDPSEATLKYILRDHDEAEFQKKKETVKKVCEEVEAAHPGVKIEVAIKDSYYNMLEKIKPHFEIVEKAIAAMKTCGIEPKVEPIRGGTDGAMLSYKGLLCPNLCAGGHNFHGVYEYVSCEAMGRITELLVEIAK